ncbi:hypothetical protein Y032_0051g2136 [Ancylostoma ceylanicum]|uniref:Mos1 transposase HTH domain-containing protein n=1 Tax=Ancylostoma ceylanicum TaxID=53326 RepID=A0A016U7K7_9BILA|nr:hypothetical protein Y032_0051g2136 [Ancylostoma ceylanicum]
MRGTDAKEKEKKSIPQEHLRVIILYEWRRGTGATETVRNINGALGEESTSISTVKRCFARFKEADMDFKNKPQSGRHHMVEDSSILDAVKVDRGLAPAVSRRDSVVDIKRFSVASRLSATGKYSLDGSLMS